MRRTALLLAMALLLAAGPALADDYQQALRQAQQGLKARDPAATLGGLRRAIAAAWDRLPFTAIEVHLVSSPPQGFGQFQPRPDNVFRPGEAMILYLEPVGFRVKHDAENGYSYELRSDFNLVDAWGRVVSGRRDFGRFSGSSRHFPQQIMLTFTYNLGGLPPGEYRLETVIRDVLGQQAHTVVTPVRIQNN